MKFLFWPRIEKIPSLILSRRSAMASHWRRIDQRGPFERLSLSPRKTCEFCIDIQYSWAQRGYFCNVKGGYNLDTMVVSKNYPSSRILWFHIGGQTNVRFHSSGFLYPKKISIWFQILSLDWTRQSRSGLSIDIINDSDSLINSYQIHSNRCMIAANEQERIYFLSISPSIWCCQTGRPLDMHHHYSTVGVISKNTNLCVPHHNKLLLVSDQSKTSTHTCSIKMLQTYHSKGPSTV